MARYSWVRRGLLIVMATVGATTGAEAASGLVPHQAIYRLSLASDSPNSRFNGIDGAAVSLVERTCEGWSVNEQVIMTMYTVAGGAIERETNFTAQETLDGRSFVFDMKSVTNGRSENYSGSAERDEAGKAEAEFITPRPFEMPLPDGTRFYLGLTNWLTNLAASGQKSGETFAFDGTDDEGPQKVSAFILPDPGPHQGLQGDQELLSARGWQAQLAFFDLKNPSSGPDFEVSLRILENGVITHFKLVFDDLTVTQQLDDVLPARDERCG